MYYNRIIKLWGKGCFRFFAKVVSVWTGGSKLKYVCILIGGILNGIASFFTADVIQSIVISLTIVVVALIFAVFDYLKIHNTNKKDKYIADKEVEKTKAIVVSGIIKTIVVGYISENNLTPTDAASEERLKEIIEIINASKILGEGSKEYNSVDLSGVIIKMIEELNKVSSNIK